MMGFASDKAVADEKYVVPRRLVMGNFKLCGVLLNYANDAMVQMLKTAMGWNVAPRALGERISEEIVQLVRSGAVRPIIGQTVPFGELAAAVDALARRATTGRTIVLL
jgi:NADPH:quinone reductase-like Zn-dependent oxidoreductase